MPGLIFIDRIKDLFSKNNAPKMTIDQQINHWQTKTHIIIEDIKKAAQQGQNAEYDLYQAVALEEFSYYGKKCYQFASEFTEQLLRTDINLPAKLIPRERNAFSIDFPLSFRPVAPDGTVHHGAFIHISPQSNVHEDNIPRDVLIMVLPGYLPNGKLMDVSDVLLMYLDERENLRDSFDLMVSAGRSSAEQRPLVEFLLKAIIYIFSGDPDLREFKRAEIPPNLPRRERDRLIQLNAELPPIPVTRVGFEWKKSRIYLSDGTTVSGHPRWQPYGPGRTKVKLIWIDEHERHFKKSNDET